MGLDSVELIMGWEAAFGIHISDDEAFALRTPRMAMDLINWKLGAEEQPQQFCLTQRTFHRLRASAMSVTSISRQSFRPIVRLKDLADRKQWSAIRSHCGIASKPGGFSVRTVADLTRWAMINIVKDWKEPNEPWTRAEVRSVVRAVVSDVLGVEEFGDNDDFIYDLRVD